jgi:hypothetical protein
VNVAHPRMLLARRRAAVASALLVYASYAGPSVSDPSTREAARGGDAVGRAIAPVEAAIMDVRAQQAALPPPKTAVEQLMRLRQMDQVPRQALAAIDFATLSASEKSQAWTAIARLLEPIDRSNQETFLKILPSEGWFTISHYGPSASDAAFFIVQHSNKDLWVRFIPILTRLAVQGEVDGASVAFMEDRLAMTEGRPQRYGSQMTCVGGKRIPAATEDLEHLDERRKSLGMSPYAQYLKRFEYDTC